MDLEFKVLIFGLTKLIYEPYNNINLNGGTYFNTFETIHNYISFEDNIVRKGAISAKKGEKILIPINMRDGSIIAIGKGNEDWNNSAPHGAGRIMSRMKAKETLKKQCNIADERNQLLKENEELKHKYDKALSDLVKAEKENKKLKRLIAHKNGYTQQLEKDLFENCSNYVISKQKVKDIIERIDYDIKKTKEIISNNADDWTSNRKNDYQIVRLRAMNTKSLDIKNRLEEILEEKGE